MRTSSFAAWALSSILALASVGCGDADETGEGGGTSGSETTSGTETTGTGETTAVGTGGSTGTGALEVPGGPGTPAKADYPAGPYGDGEGSIAPNFTFVGYTRPSDDQADLETVSLADFYNPTGAELFPMDGRAWQGQAKPKALSVQVAAFWCGPCRQESNVTIPQKKAQMGAQGGEFLILLADGEDGGVAPIVNELDRWVSNYDVTVPAALDPNGDFQSICRSNYFPQNVLIRTSDMMIIRQAETPDAGYWQAMQLLLVGG